jgi:trehalose 6-phosphate synthase
MVRTLAPLLVRPWRFAGLALGVATVAGTVMRAAVRARQGGRLAPGDAEPWTASRLKQVMCERLAGQRLIVVSNREPLIHNGNAIAPQHAVSGLVTALEPVMRACSGVWVAHGSGKADRQASDSNGRVTVSGDGGSYILRRVWLTDDEERGYYDGCANEALWPLCHRAHAQPLFRRDDWAHYRRVNQRFADAVADEAGSDEPLVLVQDYHFALVPRMLRDRFPQATILTFWHVPWPNADRFTICPYRDELLDGLLGSTIIGLQTSPDCRNFLESVDKTLESHVDRETMAIAHQGHTTAVRPYPISIEWPSKWALASPAVSECRETVRHDLEVGPDARIVVSVDRLDYTKGIEERLLTLEKVLERWPKSEELPVFVQIASPSRVRIDRYREFGERIRGCVDRINARFGAGGRLPVVFINRHCEPPEIFRYYRAADICYVSSLHDGMNLVAKEFVAARDDELGVLVLSGFAGASRELTEALVVNPYDLDGVADTLFAALAMPPAEQCDRMRTMRAVVSAHNVYGWAGTMLIDAARSQRNLLRSTISV